MHLADVGSTRAQRWMRRRPAAPGLVDAMVVTAAPLSASLLPRPQVGRLGLIAAWEDAAAMGELVETTPFADGWHVLMEPVRVYGRWSRWPELPSRMVPVADDEPVVVLTLGQLRLLRTVPFLRASARAEGAAVAHPALIASTGLARPPRFVATFSVWRSAAEMRGYAAGSPGEPHPAAVAAHEARPFHRESAFVRFRPLSSAGRWDGRDPVAGVAGIR